jgi:hypothetical protein
MPINKKPQPKPFNQPQRPPIQNKPRIVQLKTGVAPTTIKQPVAPPVYRPQPAPHCVQAKMPHPAHVKTQPVAPPVYRPQPLPKVMQTKTAVGPQTRVVQPSAIPPAHSRGRVVAPPRVSSVVQQSESKKRKAKDDDEEFLPPHLMEKEKQLRFNFLAGTPENVTKAKGHKAVHFEESRYNGVYTCRACKRMLAYEDKKGEFTLTPYAYISKSEKRHDVRALALDHFPEQWSVKLKKLVRKKASAEEMRNAYQDESGLRPLCKVCNESHAYEYVAVPDYRSDEDDEDFEPPRTPPHESALNKGSFSGYRDPEWLEKY